MRFTTAIVAALLLSLPALAAPAPVGANVVEERGVVLSAVAANAVAATRTFTVTNTGGSGGMLILWANFTWSAASAVTMTCSASNDAGATLYALQDGATAAGVQTLTDAVKSKAVTASKKWPMRFDILGFSFVSCVYAATGGGASDLMTMRASVVVP